MAITKTDKLKNTNSQKGYFKRLSYDLYVNRAAYLLFLPVFIWYFVFHYVPMYGIIISFKNYSPALGFLGSPWVGLKHFKDFFDSYYFLRLIKNTLSISICSLVFVFPAGIILALLLNEVKSNKYKRVVQTITYLPHFVSLVVICGIIRNFVAEDGVINDIIAAFGGERANLLNMPQYYVPIYIISAIWQGVGWGSIIYLAALSGIDTELYEAASIDGAGRLRQLWHITLPGITPTIVTMFIIAVGGIMSVGYEKVLLLYNPAIYDVSDVISTFVYRKGLLENNYSYSSAVGLFTSLINFILVMSSNWLSRKLTERSLW